jgi:hypothetical protein
VPRSAKRSRSIRILHQGSLCTSILRHTCIMSRPFHLFLFDRPDISWGVQIKRFIIQFHPVFCYFLHLSRKISFLVLCSRISLSFCLPSVCKHVSRLCKTGEVMHILRNVWHFR